jgi:hypothetical protein
MKKVNKSLPVGLNYKPNNVTVGKNKSSSFFVARHSCFLRTRLLTASIEIRDDWRIVTDVSEVPVFSILKPI